MVKRIPLNSRKYPYLAAIIDKEDQALVMQHKWNPLKSKSGDDKFYAITRFYDNQKDEYRTISMHRMIMGEPKGLVIDHLNGDGLDNRRDNLEIVSQKINMRRAKDFTKPVASSKHKIGTSFYMDRNVARIIEDLCIRDCKNTSQFIREALIYYLTNHEGLKI